MPDEIVCFFVAVRGSDDKVRYYKFYASYQKIKAITISGGRVESFILQNIPGVKELQIIESAKLSSEELQDDNLVSFALCDSDSYYSQVFADDSEDEEYDSEEEDAAADMSFGSTAPGHEEDDESAYKIMKRFWGEDDMDEAGGGGEGMGARDAEGLSGGGSAYAPTTVGAGARARAEFEGRSVEGGAGAEPTTATGPECGASAPLPATEAEEGGGSAGGAAVETLLATEEGAVLGGRVVSEAITTPSPVLKANLLSAFPQVIQSATVAATDGVVVAALTQVGMAPLQPTPLATPTPMPDFTATAGLVSPMSLVVSPTPPPNYLVNGYQEDMPQNGWMDNLQQYIGEIEMPGSLGIWALFFAI